MAALTVPQRTQVWRGLMRFLSLHASEFPFPASVSKLDLYNPTTNAGALANIDGWVDTHAANTAPDTVGFNGSLPEPFKSNAGPALKSLCLLAVVSMRQGVTFVRLVFGEVD